LKVSANVKIAVQCFEIFGWGGKCPPWLRASSRTARIGIKLPAGIVYCVRSSLPHTTR